MAKKVVSFFVLHWKKYVVCVDRGSRIGLLAKRSTFQQVIGLKVLCRANIDRSALSYSCHIYPNVSRGPDMM
jgi:hypothetical protein